MDNDSSHNHFNIHDELNKIHHTLKALKHLGELIMTVISDFVAAQNAFNDRMDVAIADLQDDIKNLDDQIELLKTNAITPEDQVALNDLANRTKVMADKLDALDALTPPVPPVV